MSDVKSTKRAFNLKIKQLDTAEKGKNSNGKTRIKFKGELTLRGKLVVRTVSAQGVAADKIIASMRKGTVHSLRCLFERAPANDNGRGGEFLTVVDVPLPPKQKAA